jgi:hypothetical protein
VGWNLLLAAASGECGGLEGDRRAEKIRARLTEIVDWQSLLDLAERHGVSCLLYRSLQRFAGAVPASAGRSLGQYYERNIHKTLFLARELIRILDSLDEMGITALPYKGVVMAEQYYGDMALRQSGDMDLLVRTQDLPRIKRAVTALGYTTRLPVPENAQTAYLAAGYEWTFDSAAGQNLLELQWALQPRYYSVAFDMEGLFARAVSVNLAGRFVKTPSPEDLLLVLSLHAAKHVWGRLVWLCDIARILRLENLDLDWIRRRARELGMARILHVTILLANRLLAAEIPPAMAKAISADRAAQTLVEEIAVSMAAGVEYEGEKISYFRLMMRLRERPRDRWRFATRLAFTPGPGEWALLPLPQPLFPFYRIVRLARLLRRLAA